MQTRTLAVLLILFQLIAVNAQARENFFEQRYRGWLWFDENAREQEELWRVEDAPREDDLSTREELLLGCERLAAAFRRERARAIEVLAFEVGDADRAARFVEENARDERLCPDLQRVAGSLGRA